MFNVRLQIALADFTAELGVVLVNDLSAMIDRGSHIEEWRWPLEGDDRRRVSMEISEALGSKGLPWLEACLDPSQLAARLESEKRFNSDTDEERAALTSWNDYTAIFEGRFPDGHPEAVALRERRAFLEAKCAGT